MGENLDQELQDAEVLVIRLKNVDKTLMDKAPNLKIIASPTTGLNHIDLAEVEKRGIKIVSLKGRRDITEKIYATSELTVGLMFAVMRRIHDYHNHVMDGGWNRQRYIGQEISGKTIGFIGCGRLGIRVAEIVKAMGAKAIGTDPYQDPKNIPSFIEMMPEDDLLAQSDIVTLHAELRPDNEKMIGASQFSKMKKGAYFINTARGQLVDETALLQALESGHLAGAAIDVMDKEDQQATHLPGNPLLAYAKTHPNLVIVPHIGGATRESMGLTEIAIANEVTKQLS